MTFVFAAARLMPAHRITAVASGLALASAACLFLGCSSDDTAEPDPVPSGTIALTDQNNFQGDASLNPPSTTTAVGEDLQISWDAIDSNLLCHEAEEILRVSFVRLGLTSQAEANEVLVSGDVSSYSDGDFQVQPAGATQASLSDFNTGTSTPDFLMLADDYFVSDDHTYLLVFSASTTIGKETQSLMYLEPSADSDNTTVVAEGGCDQLVYDANLSDLTPVSIPPSEPWVVDWRDITRTGDGQPVRLTGIDRVLIGFYEGRDVAYIEENIFDIEVDPQAKLWEVALAQGRSADLADAKAADGSAFPGFETDAEGTWLLGLFCSSCTSPAPVFLTILEPGQ